MRPAPHHPHAAAADVDPFREVDEARPVTDGDTPPSAIAVHERRRGHSVGRSGPKVCTGPTQLASFERSSR